jgi:hypothetical protein
MKGEADWFGRLAGCSQGVLYINNIIRVLTGCVYICIHRVVSQSLSRDTQTGSRAGSARRRRRFPVNHIPEGRDPFRQLTV